jgi:hypothetical protein
VADQFERIPYQRNRLRGSRVVLYFWSGAEPTHLWAVQLWPIASNSISTLAFVLSGRPDAVAVQSRSNANRTGHWLRASGSIKIKRSCSSLGCSQ